MEMTDSLRKLRDQIIRRETERIQRAGREVFDQKIGAVEQTCEKFAAALMLQVKSDAAFVEIEKREQPAALLDAPRDAAPACARPRPKAGSTLTTSAPMSASNLVAYGPAMK